jgi:hypothetical protein
MFYSQLILSKKGPLGKIWLAAHFEKKLTKAQIFSTDIANTCDWLLNPSEPLSLRVCGHLMLGIVKIYSRKVKYLMVDCTDAVWKIQLTFKPGKVDIDPQMPQVDDNKFFGNISGEMEYPVLENTAFASSLLPLRDRNLIFHCHWFLRSMQFLLGKKKWLWANNLLNSRPSTFLFFLPLKKKWKLLFRRQKQRK